MLFPLVDAAEWCKQHNLTPFEQPCANCGKIQITNIPWASAQFRGLKSTVCECGKGCDISTACVADPEERKAWIKNVSRLIKTLDSSKNKE